MHHSWKGFLRHPVFGGGRSSLSRSRIPHRHREELHRKGRSVYHGWEGFSIHPVLRRGRS